MFADFTNRIVTAQFARTANGTRGNHGNAANKRDENFHNLLDKKV
jgi:hypothetical protein